MHTSFIPGHISSFYWLSWRTKWFLRWNSKKLLSKDWEHKRIFKDSWAISSSSPVEIEGKNKFWRISRLSWTYSDRKHLQHHVLSSRDMVCQKSCIKMYTTVYARVTNLSRVERVILVVFYLMSIWAFFRFQNCYKRVLSKK